jgi:hypothetical protein
MTEHKAMHPALFILACEFSDHLNALFTRRAKVEFAAAR